MVVMMAMMRQRARRRGLGLLPLRSQVPRGAPTSSWYRACPVHPVSSLGAVERGQAPKGASREYLRCTGVRVRGAALVMRQNYGGGMAFDWSTPPGQALSIPAKNRVWNCATVNESLSVRKVGGARPVA